MMSLKICTFYFRHQISELVPVHRPAPILVQLVEHRDQADVRARILRGHDGRATACRAPVHCSSGRGHDLTPAVLVTAWPSAGAPRRVINNEPVNELL